MAEKSGYYDADALLKVLREPSPELTERGDLLFDRAREIALIADQREMVRGLCFMVADAQLKAEAAVRQVQELRAAMVLPIPGAKPRVADKE